MDKDKLNNPDPGIVVLTAFQTIEALQKQPAHIQVGAFHLLVWLITHKFKLDLSESMSRIDNMMRDIHKNQPDLARAISMYIEKELQ